MNKINFDIKISVFSKEKININSGQLSQCILNYFENNCNCDNVSVSMGKISEVTDTEVNYLENQSLFEELKENILSMKKGIEEYWSKEVKVEIEQFQEGSSLTIPGEKGPEILSYNGHKHIIPKHSLFLSFNIDEIKNPQFYFDAYCYFFIQDEKINIKSNLPFPDRICDDMGEFLMFKNNNVYPEINDYLSSILEEF